MSDSQVQTRMPDSLDADDVIAFLKANPRFLSDHPQAMDYLVPPKQGDGRKVKDFTSFMIERLKSDKAQIAQTTREIVENARNNMNNQQRIHKVVLRLLEARSFDEFIEIVTNDMASMLDTDISVMVVESNGQDIPHIHTSGIRIVPGGTIDKWMGGKNVLLQDNIMGIEALYGGAYTLVASQALLRIDISMDTPPAVIAFGSRDPHMFMDGQATDQVDFLARVVERVFRSWLNLPR